MLNGHGKELARFIKDKLGMRGSEIIHVMQDGCLIAELRRDNRALEYVIQENETGHTTSRATLAEVTPILEESGYQEEPDFLW